jgi:dolichol-phosphate mannosyltransferase
MDGDLQELPEAIPELYKVARGGHDLVLARKRIRRQPLIRRFLAASYFRALNTLSRAHHEPRVGNFRMLSRENVRWILARGVHSWLFGLVGDPERPSAIVDVEHAERFAGVTSYRWSRRINMAVEGISCGWFGAPIVSENPPQFSIAERTDEGEVAP